MIMPTISRTISKATSERWAGSKRPNTLILTLLLLRSELERDVLFFLRLELIAVYGHWCAEFPRTLIFHRLAEKGSSRKLSRIRRAGAVRPRLSATGSELLESFLFYSYRTLSSSSRSKCRSNPGTNTSSSGPPQQ